MSFLVSDLFYNVNSSPVLFTIVKSLLRENLHTMKEVRYQDELMHKVIIKSRPLFLLVPELFNNLYSQSLIFVCYCIEFVMYEITYHEGN